MYCVTIHLNRDEQFLKIKQRMHVERKHTCLDKRETCVARPALVASSKSHSCVIFRSWMSPIRQSIVLISTRVFRTSDTLECCVYIHTLLSRYTRYTSDVLGIQYSLTIEHTLEMLCSATVTDETFVGISAFSEVSHSVSSRSLHRRYQQRDMFDPILCCESDGRPTGAEFCGFWNLKPEPSPACICILLVSIAEAIAPKGASDKLSPSCTRRCVRPMLSVL